MGPRHRSPGARPSSLGSWGLQASPTYLDNSYYSPQLWFPKPRLGEQRPDSWVC